MSQWGMSKTAYAAVDAWAKKVAGESTDEPEDCFQIKTRGDVLYSYGTHFELARPLRNKRGKIDAYLLNGDTYSQTTSSHQSHVRHVLRGKRVVIIPHEPLESAGIDLDSIRIIDVLDDRWTHTPHTSTTFPEGAKWWVRDIEERQLKSDAAIGAMLTKEHASAIRDLANKRRYYYEALKSDKPSRAIIWQRYIDQPMPTRPSRDILSDWQLHHYVKVGVAKTLHTGRQGNGAPITITEQPDGSKLYEWTTSRHWLGEALIRARVTWRTQHQCPDCGGFGTYPGIGQYAWHMVCTTCNGRGGVSKAHHRWAYYLSGFDHEESQPLYFFCELPTRAKPATVAEAYEALKPDPVKMAEQMGRPVFRQGDIFGVPLDRVDAKALKAMEARVVRRKSKNEFRELQLPYLLGTNHTATEVAYLPNGVTLARGTMYHDPEGRRPDHARRRLGDGKTWHVVVKNTVPLSGRR